MGTGDKATSFGLQHGRVTLRPHQQKILQTCKQHADQYIGALLKQVLDKFDEALINRGNKGGDEPGVNDDVVAAERELREKRQDILAGFSEGFTRNYTLRLNSAGTAAAGKKEGGQAGGLSLVDEQELEESLAVDGLVARARDRLRNELYALAKRFNVLIDGAHYDDESQPYDPEVIGYAFRDVIQKLELKVEIKLIAYKLFEQSVMQGFGQFYLQLNSILSNAGILPELKLAVPLRAVGGTSQPRMPAAQGAATAAEHSAASAQGQGGVGHGGGVAAGDVYQTLQTLMNARKYGDASDGGVPTDGGYGAGGGWEGPSVAGPGVPPGSSLLADDLLRALSLLQHAGPQTAFSGPLNVGAIKDALLGQMKQIGDERGIDPAHDNTIDVIGMIFEFILDEPSIPEVVKSLLNQLQIPILKIAIVDKEFFTNKNHPARRLLNVLGHASIGWNENDEDVRQRRFEKMEYIVKRVLNEFEQDPGIFSGLLGEFIEFLTKEGEAVEGEAVTAADAELQEKALPNRLVFETIEARLEGAEVPGVLRDFLRGTWRDVMQHVLDTDGQDSDAWRSHEGVLDDLMWSVEPKTTADERRKMVMLLPRLLDALRRGMILIDCSQQQMDDLINALEPIHMACLRGEKYVAAPVAPVAAAAEDPAAAVEEKEAPAMTQAVAEEDRAASAAEMSEFEKELLGMESSFAVEDADHPEPEPVAIEDEFTALAAEMELGTWLEFDLDGKKRRAKLAWKSVVMGEYVFVDRKYKVVAERTLVSLAADLRQGKAGLVEDVAMFDRALDKVLNGLMSGNRTVH